MLEVEYVVLSVNTFENKLDMCSSNSCKIWAMKGSLGILLLRWMALIVLTRLLYVTNSMIISYLLLTILMIVSLPLTNLPLSIWATGYLTHFSVYLPLLMRCKNYFPLLFARDAISNQFPCLSRNICLLLFLQLFRKFLTFLLRRMCFRIV